MADTMTETAAAGSKRIRWTALAVGVVVVALIGLFAFGTDERLDGASRVVGERVPEVAGTTLDGDAYDIDNARGKWVVVNFFATWCGPCINEHPELVAFDEWAEETGRAELVAVVFNDPPDVVAQFFAENGGDWPVLDEPSLPLSFQVSQVPETFVVAPSGQVVQQYRSEITAEALIDVIETAEGDG